jgi:hypothetical protein
VAQPTKRPKPKKGGGPEHGADVGGGENADGTHPDGDGHSAEPDHSSGGVDRKTDADSEVVPGQQVPDKKPKPKKPTFERLNEGIKKGGRAAVDPDHSDMEQADLGKEPDIKPPVPPVLDEFDDEGGDQLTRLRSRIRAIREGGNRKRPKLSEDDPDLHLVDLNLTEKFAATVAERQRRMKKTLRIDDPEMQKDIANALAETLKPKWPEYVALGFKLAFVIGDIALIVNGITDDFYLVNIPTKEIIQGAVSLVKRAMETPEEKAAAIRNGRGEDAEALEQRRRKGEVALMELAGVSKLNEQQRETYDRLRVLLAMEAKASAVEDSQKK